MSLTKINTYSYTSIEPVDNTIDVLNDTIHGFMRFSLTNMDNIAQPYIAAGSVIEIAGNLMKAETNQIVPVPSGISDGNTYYYAVSVNKNTGDVICEIVSITPFILPTSYAYFTWNNNFQGWYENDTASAVNRRIAWGSIRYQGTIQWISKALLEINKSGERFTAIQGRFLFTQAGTPNVYVTGVDIDAYNEIQEIEERMRISLKRSGLYRISAIINITSTEGEIYNGASWYLRHYDSITGYYRIINSYNPTGIYIPYRYSDPEEYRGKYTSNISHTGYFSAGDWISPYVIGINGIIPHGNGCICIARYKQ